MGPLSDARWMGAALALAERGVGRAFPNPSVGCVLVKDGRVVGRGWTQPGGRPHAEAMALAQAGADARGATAYVTLEPCAHVSARGPACADGLIAAGIARAVVACGDPDPRTDGDGIARLRAAGIDVTAGVREAEARGVIAGFLARLARGRPCVTLKLATSLDGCIALANGASRWITGPEARAHAHLERARHEAILIGRGTFEADRPRLDVRLPGLEDRAPLRILLTSRHLRESGDPESQATASAALGPRFRGDDGGAWAVLEEVQAIASLPCHRLLVEGGARTAAAFLRPDLVDRLLLYRAPVLLGGKPALADLGLADLASAHGRWRLADTRVLGSDRLDVYLRS